MRCERWLAGPLASLACAFSLGSVDAAPKELLAVGDANALRPFLMVAQGGRIERETGRRPHRLFPIAAPDLTARYFAQNTEHGWEVGMECIAPFDTRQPLWRLSEEDSSTFVFGTYEIYTIRFEYRTSGEVEPRLRFNHQIDCSPYFTNAPPSCVVDPRAEELPNYTDSYQSIDFRLDRSEMWREMEVSMGGFRRTCGGRFYFAMAKGEVGSVFAFRNVVLSSVPED